MKNHTYELVIHANWGISSPDRYNYGKDKGKAIAAYKATALDGPGNVVTVRLYRDGKPWMSKYLAK